ncbi:type II secretion system F family protein [Crenobacter sp. SG2305]|uniref:type II secretion system F family protein n=1 Tax=Crenobacter oryzisoli TaxID=3056844 RepID=UPI0025AAE3D0|nr:type II secretion system F family protein [Crenobacter sp. SG2305]MDN0082475.1 type II secretion system F family protein [Crenobacter sp. SG2305]
MINTDALQERFKSLGEGAARLAFRASSSARIDAYDLLADYLSAGTSLLPALESFEKQLIKSGKEEGEFDRLRLASWIATVKQGKRFTDAIQGWVPERERMLIEASENVGQLAAGLERTVVSIERGGEIRSIWVGAMGYPVFLSVLASYVLYIYGGQVISQFAMMYSPDKWEGDARRLYLASYAMFHYWYVILTAFLVLVALVIVSLPRLTGKLRGLLDRVPPYSFYKMDEGAAFMNSLTSMLEAGRPILPAIEQIRSQATPWLAEKLDPVISEMKRGKSFGDALEMAGHHFPDRKMVPMMILHSGKSSFISTLPKLVERWIKGSIKSMRKKAAFLNQLSMIAVAMFAGWMYLAMTGLSSMVTDAMRAGIH